jgi:hypothetical protein
VSATDPQTGNAVQNPGNGGGGALTATDGTCVAPLLQADESSAKYGLVGPATVAQLQRTIMHFEYDSATGVASSSAPLASLVPDGAWPTN